MFEGVGDNFDWFERRIPLLATNTKLEQMIITGEMSFNFPNVCQHYLPFN